MTGHTDFSKLADRMTPERQLKAVTMAATVSRFDATEYLDTDEARVEYLRCALETNDTAFIIHAAATVTRSVAKSHAAAMDAFAHVNREDAEVLRAMADR